MSLEGALYKQTTEPKARINQNNSFVLDIPEESLVVGTKIEQGSFSEVYRGYNSYNLKKIHFI